MLREIQAIDSHTGGEPTRVILDGFPDLGRGSLTERLRCLREEHDQYRRAVLLEPRGSDILVGALLVEPRDPDCAAGVIFFDNVTYLGMCGHGLIGVVTTLAYLGRIGVGEHRIETPVGVVKAELHRDGSVAVTNIPSYRLAKAVPLEVDGHRPLQADIAYGGNWFCLIEQHQRELSPSRIPELTAFCWQVRQAVNGQGFPEVDHIVLLERHDDSARTFVLCPGKAYDRSPCGTGTSAYLACLASDELLAEGASWKQESIIGSRFVGRYRWLDREAGRIIPTITGAAHVTGRTTLILDTQHDPFCYGIPL
jgi:4-hydroxyproline epimerase